MRHDRHRLIAVCAFAALLAGAAGTASGEEENRVTRDAKQAGRDMKSGIGEFGRGMLDVFKGVGQGAKNFGREVGQTAKDAPKDVADGIKHGDKKGDPSKPKIPLADP